MIRFFLNGELTSVQNIDNDVTLLRYLRSQRALSATKEGCGSGDCGACSVLCGEKSEGVWRYKAVNSCITLMTQLEGKSLITVEALSGANQPLHPAQQAMVDYHGSQCGFCTPGIVMSLAAMHEGLQGQAADQQQILDALSGNLCRCTGYRPIIAAAENMHQYPDSRDSRVQLWQPADTESAPGVSAQQSTALSQSWVPHSEEELAQLLADHPDARLVAGATDLALEVTQMQRSLPKLISLHRIPELAQIRVEEDAVLIGAAATYTALEQTLRQEFPEFAQLLHRLGSRQVRNNGTLGGNIGNASPIGDTPPVLIALSAGVELASQNGSRWLALDQFFIDYKKTALQPGEYIRTIRIPRLTENQHLKVFKISKRLEDDISAVLAAFCITAEKNQHGTKIISDIRTGFGGLAAIPKAATQLQTALLKQPLTLETFEQAAASLDQDFSPMSDVRASARYRLTVAKNLLKKCVLEIQQPRAVSRVENIHSPQVHADMVLTVAGEGHA